MASRRPPASTVALAVWAVGAAVLIARAWAGGAVASK